MNGQIILASASPRRQTLLERLGYQPVILPSHIDEERTETDPARLAELLAHDKLEAVRASVDSAVPPGAIPRVLLAADTVVALDSRIYGKPKDAAEAEWMLRRLSGKQHRVVTGVCVRALDGEPGSTGADRPILRNAVTRVTFRELDEAELRWYLGLEEWQGVAGAYRIQDAAAALVDRIDGDYSNVMGLPLPLVCAIFARLGLFPPG